MVYFTTQSYLRKLFFWVHHDSEQPLDSTNLELRDLRVIQGSRDCFSLSWLVVLTIVNSVNQC